MKPKRNWEKKIHKNETIYTREGLAKELGVSSAMISYWVKKGKLQSHYEIGLGTYYFKPGAEAI